MNYHIKVLHTIVFKKSSSITGMVADISFSAPFRYGMILSIPCSILGPLSMIYQANPILACAISGSKNRISWLFILFRRLKYLGFGRWPGSF